MNAYGIFPMSAGGLLCFGDQVGLMFRVLESDLSVGVVTAKAEPGLPRVLCAGSYNYQGKRCALWGTERGLYAAEIDRDRRGAVTKDPEISGAVTSLGSCDGFLHVGTLTAQGQILIYALGTKTGTVRLGQPFGEKQRKLELDLGVRWLAQGIERTPIALAGTGIFRFEQGSWRDAYGWSSFLAASRPGFPQHATSQSGGSELVISCGHGIYRANMNRNSWELLKDSPANAYRVFQTDAGQLAVVEGGRPYARTHQPWFMGRRSTKWESRPQVRFSVRCIHEPSRRQAILGGISPLRDDPKPALQLIDLD